MLWTCFGQWKILVSKHIRSTQNAIKNLHRSHHLEITGSRDTAELAPTHRPSPATWLQLVTKGKWLHLLGLGRHAISARTLSREHEGFQQNWIRLGTYMSSLDDSVYQRKLSEGQICCTLQNLVRSKTFVFDWSGKLNSPRQKFCLTVISENVGIGTKDRGEQKLKDLSVFSSLSALGEMRTVQEKRLLMWFSNAKMCCFLVLKDVSFLLYSVRVTVAKPTWQSPPPL